MGGHISQRTEKFAQLLLSPSLSHTHNTSLSNLQALSLSFFLSLTHPISLFLSVYIIYIFVSFSHSFSLSTWMLSYIVAFIFLHFSISVYFLFTASSYIWEIRHHSLSLRVDLLNTTYHTKSHHTTEVISILHFLWQFISW